MQKFLSILFALGLLASSVTVAQAANLVAPAVESSENVVVETAPAQSEPAQAGKIILDTETSSFVPAPPTEKFPFGQSHLYTVTLRGNGEALVYLKAIFSNKEKAALSSLQFTFPAAPTNLSAYQVIRAPQCIRYRSELSARPVDLSTKGDECIEYQEPDYQYGWGNTSFEKAQVTVNGSEVTVTLPSPVKGGGAGSILFSYNDQNATSKDAFGAYNYTFSTIKVNDTIQNVQVGIVTDPDYYLKDTQGTINYQTKEAAGFGGSMLAMDRVAGNAQFDQFYNQIGYGTIVKNASNLQSNESFTVKGMYASNKMQLYGTELMWGILITVVLLALAFGSLFFGMRKGFSKSEAHGKATTPVLLVSFGSSLFVLLYTMGLYFVSAYFGQMYTYYPSGNLFPVVMLLVAVISLSIYSLFLFVPSVLLGFKKGAVPGILTFVLTLFWLILYGVIIVVLFFVFFKGNTPSPVVMPLGFSKSAEMAASAPAADVMIMSK